MKNLRRLARRTSRLLGNGKQAQPLRISSYPFISGDTFRLGSDIVIDAEHDWRLKLQSWQSSRRPQIFVENRYLYKPETLDLVFESLIDTLEVCENRATVLFHNGDKPPPAAALIKLAELGATVFSQNNPDLSGQIEPLPIGLENPSFSSPNILRPFLEHLKSDGMIDCDQRRNVPLVSFRVRTNPEIRVPLERLAASRGLANLELSRSSFFQEVKASKFVLAPPGNGVDCHRTWEAIALGAIPVTLSHPATDPLLKELPALIVQDWSEFLDLSEQELAETYETLSRRSKLPSMFDYWVLRLSETSRDYPAPPFRNSIV